MLKPETEEQARERLAKYPDCVVRELDLTKGYKTSWSGDLVRSRWLDPWNINHWKDWEFCQGTYRKIYSIDTNIPRKEIKVIDQLMKQINAESKKKNQFVLVNRLPIVLEKKDKYDSLIFYVYDTKSTITREYTIQYKWIDDEKIEIINGFRTRTVFEDNFLTTGYNNDQYNQFHRKYESYYMSLDKPKYYPMPMNINPFSFSNVPSNLYMETGKKYPEKSGTFKAYMFND